MLKNLDNRLNAEVLYALRAMGHGDTLVIADTNFPSDSIARQTVLGELSAPPTRSNLYRPKCKPRSTPPRGACAR